MILCYVKYTIKWHVCILPSLFLFVNVFISKSGDTFEHKLSQHLVFSMWSLYDATVEFHTARRALVLTINSSVSVTRYYAEIKSRSQWPRCLRRGSAAALCWVCGFEARRGHGCLYLVCCQVEVPPSGWSLVQRSPTEYGVYEYEREVSIMRTPCPTSGCRAMRGGCRNKQFLLSVACWTKKCDWTRSWKRHKFCTLFFPSTESVIWYFLVILCLCSSKRPCWRETYFAGLSGIFFYHECFVYVLQLNVLLFSWIYFTSTHTTYTPLQIKLTVFLSG
jgi:hypothetical protein